uniref:Uncharacterized protein n=1 Tax=Arundo donax TaxID=35708 RepID=A0A0A9C166_ARUDO
MEGKTRMAVGGYHLTSSVICLIAVAVNYWFFYCNVLYHSIL